MRKYLLLLTLLVGLVIPTVAQNKYIVVLKDNQNVGQFISQHRGKVKVAYDTVLNGYAATLTDDELALLKQDSGVKYIEPDAVIPPATIEDNVAWPLFLVNQRGVITYPAPYSYEYFNTGQGVNVYILDSGILTYHPDFGGRASEVWTVRKGKNANPDQSQCGSHGTLVAGVVGGTVTGVAKNVNLLSVTMTQCTSGAAFVSDMLNAMNFVARKKGTKIANISYAGGFQQTVYDAIENGYQKGVVWTLAAGNEGIDACTQIPAAAPDAITIGGVTNNGYDNGYLGNPSPPLYFTGFNYGTCVDAFAGILGWTDWYTNAGDMHTGDVFGGTSFAAPVAAGIAALYLEQHPNASPREVIDAVLSQATPDVLHITGPGSPNLLLYTKVQ